MKIISKILIIVFLSVLSFICYVTFFGLETKRFNDQITRKIKDINQNFELELKPIKIIFEPFELKFNAKTIGSKLIYGNKSIEIENIKTQIPLSSLFSEKFLIENLEVSSKPLKIKDVISFTRVFNNSPELFILDKITKKGFLIVDLKLDFDEKGNIRNNFQVNGFLKDAKIEIFKKYKIGKLNFTFDYNKKTLNFFNTSFSLNNLDFSAKNLNFTITKKKFLKIEGEVESKELDLDDRNIELFLKPYFPDLDIKKLKFSSKNKFSFEINDKFRVSDFDLVSDINLTEIFFSNKMKIKNIFPHLNNDIKFLNHSIKINYEKNIFMINGSGNVLLQKNYDELAYSIKYKDKKYDFKTSAKINNNPFILNFLNYEKDINNQMNLELDGSFETDKIIKFNSIVLKEENNIFKIIGLIFNKKFKVTNFKNFQIDYLDKDNIINKLNIIRKKNNYLISGISFNANNLIENFIDDNDNDLDIIRNNFNLDVKIDKLFLDKEYSLNNFNGNLLFNNHEIIDGNLIGSFSNNEKFVFTVKTNQNEKITTLFLDKAKPLVKRYKFIKGFSDGTLDFYSSKKGNESFSKLKIYDFKLKEVPALTKLLTLASLQGIADLLSGEGIRFNELEMSFTNKKNLMTVDELYAIGPAISILMNGYIEKNKLVSLRGTLVPATTINNAIGSIPILGKILVGSKTGEGVFGVSFKIKGPPKKLETNVNPIKTLTPRFITRTLENIKKN
jgi:hypothetical protein